MHSERLTVIVLINNWALYHQRPQKDLESWHVLEINENSPLLKVQISKYHPE